MPSRDPTRANRGLNMLCCRLSLAPSARIGPGDDISIFARERSKSLACDRFLPGSELNGRWNPVPRSMQHVEALLKQLKALPSEGYPRQGSNCTPGNLDVRIRQDHPRRVCKGPTRGGVEGKAKVLAKPIGQLQSTGHERCSGDW